MHWQSCIVCEEQTTNYCNDCAQTNTDGTISNARYYCDIDCRKKDELEHIKVHMDHHATRSNMERAIKAGNIAQSLFYTFMEKTWAYDMKNVCIKRDQDRELVSVEVTDGAGVVNAPRGYSDCGSRGSGWLIKFPKEAFGTFDADAKHALLTHRNSIWAFVVMHAAVQALFQDLVNDVQTDIKEVVHYPPRKASRIVNIEGSFGITTRRQDQLYPDMDERGDTKGVYEITLKCGSKIALDLAGAQWDLMDSNDARTPVTHWVDYWSRWGAAIKYRIPFRSHQLKHAAKMTNYRMITSQTLILEMSLYFNIFMTSGCMAQLGFNPRDLLDMETQICRDKEQGLFKEVTKYLQRRPKELDRGKGLAVFNVFHAFDLRHPTAIAERKSARPKGNRSLPLDVGSMADFNWKELSRLIQMPSSEVTLQEKKQARALQKKRSVYKEPGSWKLIFLDDTIPGPKVPAECVRENAAWTLG